MQRQTGNIHSQDRKEGSSVAKYIVKKLNMAREDVRQKSFQILFAAFNEDQKRSEINSVLPKRTTPFRKLEQTECFGVFQGAGQVGFGILSDLKGGSYRISYIAVDPTFRHDGAGRKLVHAMLSEVVARSGETVILQTEAGNKIQRKWFQSMGFSSARKGTDDGISLTLTLNDTMRAYLALCDTLDRYANLIYGFYEVEEEPYCDTYPVALVLMQPFRCSEKERDEVYHENMIHEKERLNEVLRSVSNYLTDHGFQNLPMPIPHNDVDGSLARKAAALQAGLGWFGKNDRVIHPIYGAKTVSCRIYINADFPVNTHLRKNQCGDCRACVDACPAKCLKNRKWNGKISRKEIIDESACLEYRSQNYAQTGRYSECDLCVRCCRGKK